MNAKTKKVLNILTTIATWLVVAFTVFIMLFTIVSVSMVGKDGEKGGGGKKGKSIFGYQLMIVRTDSMSKSENNKDMKVHFESGDIIIIEAISIEEASNLKAGQIISFISMNEDESRGQPITHMIKEPIEDKNGVIIAYKTFGTNTGAEDEIPVEPGLILGVYSGKIPELGNFFAFIKSVPGYIVCILTPFLLIILYNGANVIRLFRRYKKEQTAKIQAERAEIAAERREAEDMMKELLALKAQLQQQQTQTQPIEQAQPIEEVKETQPVEEVFEEVKEEKETNE
jgi:hypothetical protein